jgi:hypothetical protein
MRILFFILLGALLQACSSEQQKEPFKSFLANVNKAKIVLYNGGDSLNFETADPNGLVILKRLINGNNNTAKDTCQPVGEIQYVAQDQQIMQAQFSLAEANGCNYVRYVHNNQQYQHKLTSRAENILKQVKQAASVPPKPAS